MEDALRPLAPDARRALVAYLGRVKHDLGKYVALQVRWLPEDATVAERRRALQDDLLRTRRGPAGVQDAASLWQGLRGPLAGRVPVAAAVYVDLSDDPAVVAVDAAIAEIRALVPLLSADAADAAVVDRGCRAAVACADAVRDLDRRARDAVRGPT